MFESRDFTLHFPQTDMTHFSTRFVEKVNYSARRRAEKDNEKTHRANQLCYRHGHTAKIAQHNLQNLFAQPDAGKTDRQRSEGAFNRKHGKKIDQFDPGMKTVGHAEKCGESGKVRDERRAKSEQRGKPMSRIEVISSGNFD